MSIPNKRERNIQPTHTGEVLREDFLPDYGLTVSSVAPMIYFYAI
jgi:antitoxin HigA-1